MVEQGRITIDDKPVTAGTRVHDGAVVRVDGRQVTKEEEEIFLAFYKPKGIVCTTAQEENGEPIKNVVDYIDYPKRVYPVGRLDQASEGLLLLTNQGDPSGQNHLHHRLQFPWKKFCAAVTGMKKNILSR